MAVAWLAAALAPMPIRASDTLDFRHAEYTFTNDGAPVGPWSVYRLTYSHVRGGDTFNVEIVNGEHEDPLARVHGTFYRLENFHRLTPWLTTRASLGTGTGYSVLRSASAELVLASAPTAKYAFGVGGNVTSPSNRSLERIFAVGPEWRAGVYSGTARYYAASSVNPTAVAPATGALNLSIAPPHAIGYGLAYNVGGELSGDRTAALLPTASGRAGNDVVGTLRVPIAAGVTFSVSDENSWYRDRVGRARGQHVLTLAVTSPI